MKTKARHILLGVVASIIVIAAAGALFVYSGVYPVEATEQHTKPVYWLLKAAMRQSVRRRASSIHEIPRLDDANKVSRGRVVYEAQCVRCHGAPGVPPDAFALGMTPAPANLANGALEWPAQDLYWTIRYGLKMTGMPAWEFRLSDDDVWAVVAYLKAMPHESPQQYAKDIQAAKNVEPTRDATEPSSDGDAKRGKIAIQQYACATCHEIPGITGATVPVGPPLDHIATRGFIAGLLSNNGDNMVRWLRAPQEIHPGSAMPNLGVTERDARDITAYLYSFR